MSGVPQGSVLGQSTSVCDRDSGLKRTLSTFTADTKLRGAADTLQGRDGTWTAFRGGPGQTPRASPRLEESPERPCQPHPLRRCGPGWPEPCRPPAAPPAIGGPAPPLQGAGLPRGRGGSGGAGAGERPGGAPRGRPQRRGGRPGMAGDPRFISSGVAARCLPLRGRAVGRRGRISGVGEQRGEQRCGAAGGGSRHPCQLGLIIAGLIIAEVSPWQRFSSKYTRAVSPRLSLCRAHPSSSRAELFRERGCREPALRPAFWGGCARGGCKRAALLHCIPSGLQK